MLEGHVPQEQKSSQQLRDSIRCIKGVLEEWEATIPQQQPRQQQRQQGETQPWQQPDNAHLDILHEVISKLTPDETATVRTLLDCQSSPSADDATMQQWQRQAPATQMNANMASFGVQLCAPSLPAVAPVGMQYHVAFGGLAAAPMGRPPDAFYYSQHSMSSSGPQMSSSTYNSAYKQRSRVPLCLEQKVAKPTKNDVLEGKARSTAEEEKETLRTNLRDLSLCEHTHVIMVRKINRLGIDSPALLEAHFSKYGPVQRVMVSHSRAKSIFGRAGAARVRPAGLGFLIMSRAEDVDAILASGPEHNVEGALITTSRFESRSICDDGHAVVDPESQ